MHPPGHDITSMKCQGYGYPFSSHSLSLSITILALAKPWAIAMLRVAPFKNEYSGTVSVIGILASFTPYIPLIGVISRFLNGTSFPVTMKYAVLKAASITPPVAPNMTAAPVPNPNGWS